MSIQEFALRRQKFMAALDEESIAILPAAPESIRNGDAHYPYRQNSDFYYLTGFNEPEAIAVFIPGRTEGEFILFNRERDPALELWTGLRAGQMGAREVYGADQSFAINQFDEQLPKLLENRKRVYAPLIKDRDFSQKLFSGVQQVQAAARRGINAPNEFFNIENIIHEMRIIKSPMELELLRRAGEITAAAHIKAMRECHPGMMEYELEAIIQAEFTHNNCRYPAYSHIVGSGANTCILHYTENNKRIEDGDLVLIDAGAEYEYYAADVTRTFPANGQFSPTQKVIYEIVLAAQKATIEKVRPGSTWNELQQISEQVITQGLIDIGLLKGKLDDLLAQHAFRRFYMHRVSHWLGMDVHDAGSYKVQDRWRSLEPGMVLTVEPGIYIPANSEGVDKKWWNIGVRIEDDVAVTTQGHEIFTAAAPKTVAEIEALMS